MGHLNQNLTEEVMSNFMELYLLKNLVRVPTCYTYLGNPSRNEIFHITITVFFPEN